MWQCDLRTSQSVWETGISCFAAVDGGEVKGPVNEGVLMCQIHPFLECCKLMAIGIVDRSIGLTDKMSFRCREW